MTPTPATHMPAATVAGLYCTTCGRTVAWPCQEVARG